MTRRRGAREKGARRRRHQDQRCAKYDLRGAQPDVRSRSAAAVVGEAHSADARRRRVVLSSAGDGAASLTLGARHWKR